MQTIAAILAFLFLIVICVAIGYAIGRASGRKHANQAMPGAVTPPTPGAPTNW